ncbi:MAG: hypothetical protein KKD18_06665 [Nanoarchaeota archaeon]|nr:hypothetical protein [Nanoarchaeota archaeon]
MTENKLSILSDEEIEDILERIFLPLNSNNIKEIEKAVLEKAIKIIDEVIEKEKDCFKNDIELEWFRTKYKENLRSEE